MPRKAPTSEDFFRSWVNSVINRKNQLLSVWNNWKGYTSEIMEESDSVILDVAKDLGLCCYPRDYYKIDSVLYEPKDLVPGIPENTYWLREISVAFEHENNFGSGLYQEVAHLLITNCDLRVLVTYPDRDIKDELEYLHNIIAETSLANDISTKQNFLIIFGYPTFKWEGRVFHNSDWRKL